MYYKKIICKFVETKKTEIMGIAELEKEIQRHLKSIDRLMERFGYDSCSSRQWTESERKHNKFFQCDEITETLNLKIVKRRFVKSE